MKNTKKYIWKNRLAKYTAAPIFVSRRSQLNRSRLLPRRSELRRASSGGRIPSTCSWSRRTITVSGRGENRYLVGRPQSLACSLLHAIAAGKFDRDPREKETGLAEAANKWPRRSRRPPTDQPNPGTSPTLRLLAGYPEPTEISDVVRYVVGKTATITRRDAA